MFAKVLFIIASVFLCAVIIDSAHAFTITDAHGNKVESQKPYELQGIYFFNPSTPGTVVPFEHENTGTYTVPYKQDAGQTSIELSPAVYAETRRYSDEISSGAFAELNYQIYVKSLLPGLGDKEPIDLNIVAHGTTYAFDNGIARIGLEIEPTASLEETGPSYFDDSKSIVRGAFAGTHYKSDKISIGGKFSGFYADTFYTVTLLAEVSCLTSRNCISKAQLDPEITLASGEADRYSLLIADGIENKVSAVPLPSTAPMLGVAVLGLGLVGRARRRLIKGAAA